MKPKKANPRAKASKGKRKDVSPVIEIDLIPSIAGLSSSSGRASNRPNKKARKENLSEEDDEVIIILSDSEDSSPKISGGNTNEDDDDDEVMIVDPSAAGNSSKKDGTEYFASATAARLEGDGDDEVQAIGEKNVMRLPHMRQHCVECKFVEDLRFKSRNWTSMARNDVNEGKVCNPKTCDKCYCFICDKPVSECKNWASDEFNADDHCHASDKGQGAQYYKNQRDLAKRGSRGDDSARNGTLSPTDIFGSMLRDSMLRDMQNLHDALRSQIGQRSASRDPFSFQSGPFKPDNEQAIRDSTLTQCRKCKWWNRFAHKNFSCPVASSSRYTAAFDMGYFDWCHACGRVASERDFGKMQSKPHDPKPEDISFEKKTISFRIKPHDPRKIDEFKARWNEHGGKSTEWTYSAADTEEDFFRHRIGKHPRLRVLLDSIPITRNEEIPEVGVYRKHGHHRRNSNNDGNVSVNECEALLLENPRDLALLKILHQFQRTNAGIMFTLEAKWDRSSRKGVIEISLFIQPSLTIGRDSGSLRRPKISILLGLWFDVFPFKLSDLTRGLLAKPLSLDDKKRMFGSRRISCLNKDLTKREYDRLVEDFGDDEAVKAYNNQAELVSNTLSFQPSAKKAGCGGITGNDTSFSGTIRRAMSENIIDDATATYGDFNVANSAVAEKLGIVSDHRSIRGPRNDSIGRDEINSLTRYTSYLEKNEVSLMQNLYPIFDGIVERCSTMGGLLQQLENLGHTPIEHVEGLKVELFDFQREAVGWALERERTEGGVESFLWTKVPSKCMEVTLSGKSRTPVNLYFSPILECFKKTKPPDVRGGLIAAQMGLGKTVISLSIVLMNPAPMIPDSGSPVSGNVTSVTTQPAVGNQEEVAYIPTWPSIGPKPPDASTKHGRILSRGTLVVCNVSLVGQWIDEAKSKLKDPGLVYSYHGQGRKRNPIILAKNAIVVTTYATLASDAYHHKSKSGDPNYCPPCESVRWWRIICDESHSIRDTNTRNYKALSRLSAANKWCVTGTPMNTTPNDLKGQLNFLGLNHIDKMFSLFSGTMGNVFNSSSRRRYSYGPRGIGPFLFLMRNVMIRHSIAQTGRTSNTSIMALPPKEESTVEIEFNKEERAEYNKIEKKAIALYELLKSGGNVNRHYLRLTSALLPLRLSCSGGRIDEGQVKKKINSGKKTTKGGVEMDISDDEECAICLDHIENPRATRCKPLPHVFCEECIQGVFSGAQTIPCPCCRAPIRLSELQEVIPKETKDEKIAELNTAAKKNPAKKKTLDDSDILFRSKFERLLQELKNIRDKEPESKSLVFSQFTSTLQWMQQELPKHGFQFRTLSGDMPMSKRAKALREFQSDPPTTIFLLSLRSGAVGINLTQANRVFLMEPAMNPALEAQAIGRVYRLGQRKEVKIIRMQIKDSFESRLVQVLKKKFGEAKKPDPLEDSEKSDKVGDGDKDESDKENTGKEKAKQSVETSTVSLGHMTRDKASLITEEFDELFGVEKN